MAGLWLLPDGLKLLSGISIVFLLFTLLTNKTTILLNRIKQNKIIILSLFFTLIVIITKELYGGIYGSFMRSCIIFSVLFICIYSQNTTKRSLYIPILLGILLNSSYLIYTTIIKDIYRPVEIMNPNLYAPLFGIFLILSFNFVDFKKPTLLSVVSLISSLLLTFSVVVMQSRGVLAASLFALLALSFNTILINKSKLKTIGILLSIVFISIYFNQEKIDILYKKSMTEYGRISNGDLNSSVGLRIQMLTVGMSMIKEAPLFGHGKDYKEIKTKTVEKKSLNKVINTFSTLHNVYIDSWAKLGILGFLMTILLTLLPYLLLKGSSYWVLGLSLSSFTFIISMVDTVLLGGSFLLAIITICLILKYQPLNKENLI
ncbi:O-antigen ligase family protein [Aliivibrio logei]|nr:O-antigen ligase family protein [Aliivibrio logei]